MNNTGTVPTDEIRKSLDEAKHYDFTRLDNIVPAVNKVCSNAPIWLRSMLEENERITKESSRYHVSTLDLGRRLVAEEAKTKMLREELKQVKKENERLTGRIMQHRKALGYAVAYVVEDDPEIKNHEADTIRSELDQVKIERDAWKESSKDQFSELFMLRHELSQFESK